MAVDETTETTDEPADDELDDVEPDGDAEPDEVADESASAPAALDDREIERRLKALDREATRHAARVTDIMGEDALTLVPCPMCVGFAPGFMFPWSVEDEQRAAVLAAIGMGPVGELAHDPEARACDLCLGLGELLTGSRVDSQVTRPCPKCTAKGWTSDNDRAMWDTRVAMATPTATPDTAPTAVVVSTTPPPPTDMYSRPLGHPNYGKMPAYMTADERAADPYVT